MGEGVDYSWARPDPTCLRQSGYEFVMRYIGRGSYEKLLDNPEKNVLLANGLSIVSLCEGFEDDPLNGYYQGVQDAQIAAGWRDRIGMPPQRPVYFAVDFDAQGWQMDVIGEYFDGAASILGRAWIGVYGGFRTVEAMAAMGKVGWYYQTYAWSYGQWSAYAHVQQYQNRVMRCGGEVDLDRNTIVEYGQWGQAPIEIGPPPDSPPVDTGGLPDTQTEGPWDYNGHISSLANTFGGVATDLDNAERSLWGLIS